MLSAPPPGQAAEDAAHDRPSNRRADRANHRFDRRLRHRLAIGRSRRGCPPAAGGLGGGIVIAEAWNGPARAAALLLLRLRVQRILGFFLQHLESRFAIDGLIIL